jgi:hypothetical protein
MLTMRYQGGQKKLRPNLLKHRPASEVESLRLLWSLGWLLLDDLKGQLVNAKMKLMCQFEW